MHFTASAVIHQCFIVKMRGYSQYRVCGKAEQKFGARNFLVLTVTRMPERSANLLEATRTLDQAHGALRMFLFGSERMYGLANPAPVLESVWLTPADRVTH